MIVTARRHDRFFFILRKRVLVKEMNLGFFYNLKEFFNLITFYFKIQVLDTLNCKRLVDQIACKNKIYSVILFLFNN